MDSKHGLDSYEHSSHSSCRLVGWTKRDEMTCNATLAMTDNTSVEDPMLVE